MDQGLPSVEIVDAFTIKDNLVEFSEQKSERTYDRAVWERILNKETFRFDPNRGSYPTDEGHEPFKFPPERYLLSHDSGLSLKEVLGNTTRVFTQRRLLQELCQQNSFSSSKIRIHCVYLGGVVFMKAVKSSIDYMPRKESADDMIYRGKRIEQFNGEDDDELPVPPLKNLGQTYGIVEIVEILHSDQRILYTSNLNRYSPDGGVVEVSGVTYGVPRRHNQLALRSLLSGAEYALIMHHMKGEMTPELFTPSKYLSLVHRRNLASLPSVLLDESLLEYVRVNGSCIATFETKPIPRLTPSSAGDTPSFLSDEFHRRFE